MPSKCWAVRQLNAQKCGQAILLGGGREKNPAANLITDMVAIISARYAVVVRLFLAIISALLLQLMTIVSLQRFGVLYNLIL